MPSRDEIRELAVHWATKVIDDNLTASDEEELYRWIQANAQHAEQFYLAYWHIQVVFRNPDVRQRLRSFVEPSGSSVNVNRWRAGYALAASILFTAVVSMCLAAWHYGWVPRTYETQRAETHSVTLPDGSVAHLNAQTTVRWPGFSRARRIELVEGQALFEVVHGERPFSVQVDHAVVNVLGTRFDINRRPSVVVVTVLEGIVSVQGQEGAKQWRRVLGSDERVAFSGTQLIDDVQRADARDAVGWREGVLQLQHEPIQELIDQLARYSDKPIVIADDRVRLERVVVRIRLKDVRSALSSLEINSPIKVRETESAFLVQYRESARIGAR